MTFTAAEMRARLRALLPTRWFADEAPALDALLAGPAAAWARLAAIIDFARRQTRIATAEGAWLDAIARDFFARRLRRRAGEADADYATRIRRALRRERGTRRAVIESLTDLTGLAPDVFEPARPADTGAWGTRFAFAAADGAACAGRWGSLNLPFQCLVTARRPGGVGIARLGPWGGNTGGWGSGGTVWAASAMLSGPVSDADIRAAVTDVLPAGTIAWLRITR